MASGWMTTGPYLAALAAAERLPQGLLHWMIGVHGLYIYGGLLKRIIDPTSTVPLGDVDVIALDVKVMEVMTERFGIIFRRVNTTITRTPYFIGKAGHGNAERLDLWFPADAWRETSIPDSRLWFTKVLGKQDFGHTPALTPMAGLSLPTVRLFLLSMN